MRPVAPIPTLRIAAPRRYDLNPDKQHGPGEGRAGLLHRADLGEREVGERDEAGGPDPHAEDRGTAAVRPKPGQAAWSRGRASGPPPPRRSWRARSRRT